ncbi:natterin-3-like isoform X1 [Falco rusticolus]|uniref:natterin-3-like isoform X1 n=1 Tax=Falco rusticolus TaxID=120794 RepID=UPI001886A8DD|nr:natterin-3-like isoform X1 [Falco rusticolus]
MPACELFLAAALLFLSPGSHGDGGVARPSLLGVTGRGPPRPAPADTSWGLYRRKRDEDPPSYLKWVPFEGHLPADAVSNWNAYANRTEYVCSTQRWGCNTGAYVPQRGPLCFFPYGEWEWSTHDFKVLVNVGGFEALDWVADSFGSVPKNAVEGCPSVDVFVGRNQYGLGKVSKDQRALFVMVDGEEVWYKWYQVLVVKKGPADVTISDVRYNMSQAVENREDITVMKTTVRNEGCQGMRKTITMEEVTEREHNWQMDHRVLATIHGVLRTALLAFNGMGWGVTNVTDIPWVGGASAGEYVVRTHTVEEELRPRMACAVALEGHRVDVRVPFAAQLIRQFTDGQRHRVGVTGWAHSRAVVGVRPKVTGCWPITDILPCQP